MPAIMADHEIAGQMQVLLRLLLSAAWYRTELAVRKDYPPRQKPASSNLDEVMYDLTEGGAGK
jgi:hypothetical protein